MHSYSCPQIQKPSIRISPANIILPDLLLLSIGSSLLVSKFHQIHEWIIPELNRKEKTREIQMMRCEEMAHEISLKKHTVLTVKNIRLQSDIRLRVFLMIYTLNASIFQYVT